jgi:cytochrome c
MKLKITGLLLTIIIIFLSVFMYKANKSKAPKKPTTADIEEGKGLIANSDCLSCHRLDIKLIGPAYKDIAAKYPENDSNYNLLVQKIINGGKGIWGPVAMSPHPTLAIGDVTKMVAYILTVK